MSVGVSDMQPIPPHIVFADQRLRKSDAELVGEMMRGAVIGVDIGVG